MSRACRIVAEALDRVEEKIAPGVRTGDLDRLAEGLIRERGGVPAFKGYRGYPATLCVSINEEVVHGIPGKRILRDGDVVSVDVGVLVNGFFGDAARTVIAGGNGAGEFRKLVRTTREALAAGIAQTRAGKRLSDISHAIQRVAEENGFSVVRDFVGHGIGRALHEDPQIPNFGDPGAGPVLKEGMTFAIEPMINAGRPDVRILSDRWTAVAVDGRPSAHFEHTVAITSEGPIILTTV